MNVVRICLFIELDEGRDNPGMAGGVIVSAVTFMIADYADPWHCLSAKETQKISHHSYIFSLGNNVLEKRQSHGTADNSDEQMLLLHQQ